MLVESTQFKTVSKMLLPASFCFIQDSVTFQAVIDSGAKQSLLDSQFIQKLGIPQSYPCQFLVTLCHT